MIETDAANVQVAADLPIAEHVTVATTSSERPVSPVFVKPLKLSNPDNPPPVDATNTKPSAPANEYFSIHFLGKETPEFSLSTSKTTLIYSRPVKPTEVSEVLRVYQQAVKQYPQISSTRYLYIPLDMPHGKDESIPSLDLIISKEGIISTAAVGKKLNNTRVDMDENGSQILNSYYTKLRDQLQTAVRILDPQSHTLLTAVKSSFGREDSDIEDGPLTNRDLLRVSTSSPSPRTPRAATPRLPEETERAQTKKYILFNKISDYSLNTLAKKGILESVRKVYEIKKIEFLNAKRKGNPYQPRQVISLAFIEDFGKHLKEQKPFLWKLRRACGGKSSIAYGELLQQFETMRTEWFKWRLTKEYKDDAKPKILTKKKEEPVFDFSERKKYVNKNLSFRERWIYNSIYNSKPKLEGVNVDHYKLDVSLHRMGMRAVAAAAA
ncbi:MAG TPA: hypothetical protein VGV92_06885 [Gammaproteobacteria bacterium]|nr:hypothetical protein [Gammaproteobacteria bacterium]